MKLEEAFNSGKLPFLKKIVKEECDPNALTLVSNLNVYLGRFKDITGINSLSLKET